MSGAPLEPVALAPARAVSKFATPESHDSGDDLDGDVEDDIQLPAALGRASLEDDALEDEPEYDDLLDKRWIDGVATVEEQDDEQGHSIDVGVTLDLSLDDADDVGQVVDLDVGPLLTSWPGEAGLPTDGETERDAARDLGLHDASFGVGALHDLLLPDASDSESADEEVGDDERFPAFDETPVPASSRPDAADASDHEDIPRDDARA